MKRHFDQRSPSKWASLLVREPANTFIGHRVAPVLFVFLISLMFLSGCSSTALMYRYLDWGVEYELGKWFCPKGELKEWTGQRVDELHLWHRNERLVQVSAFLRVLASEAEDGIQEREWQQLEEWVEKQRVDLLEHVAPVAVEFFQRAGDEQWRCFLEKSREERDDALQAIAKDWDGYQKKRGAEVLNRLESWTGDLEKEQRAQAEQILAQTKDEATAFQDQRLAARRYFVETVQKERGNPQFPQLLQSWFREPTLLFEESYRSQRDQLWKRQKDAQRQVLLSLRPQQRQRFAKKLRNVADTFSGLAGSNTKGSRE